MALRDTTTFYAEKDTSNVSLGHLNFALDHGGQRIHDAAAATGDYVEALLGKGRDVTGSDLNASYVAIARERGLPVECLDATALGLPDDSVDSVLLFEVLEHLADAEVRTAMLREARRVARHRVLITTPDATYLDLLADAGLTYDHMLDRDHKIFWDEASLRADIGAVFETFTLTRREPVLPRLFPHLLRGAGHPRIANLLARATKVEIYRWFFVEATV